jgi:hypothetical protein
LEHSCCHQCVRGYPSWWMTDHERVGYCDPRCEERMPYRECNTWDTQEYHTDR